MLLFTTICLIGMGVSQIEVDAAAKPAFTLFNKNLLYGFRPVDDAPKNIMDGSGTWPRMSNPQTPGQFERAEEMIQSMNLMTGMLTNSTMFGAGAGPGLESTEVQKPPSKKYKMVVETPDHMKCETCSDNGEVRGMIVSKDNGFKKVINYAAMIAPEEPSSMNMVPPFIKNQPINGIEVQPDGLTPSPLQYYNQYSPQMNERMTTPNGQLSPMQLSQLTNAMAQSTMTPQANLQQQQNFNSFNTLSSANGVTPQAPFTIAGAPQTLQTFPASLNDQIKQQMLSRLAVAALAPQLVVQRANELMNSASSNQQQAAAASTVSPWPLGAGIIMVGPSPSGDPQAMMVNLGGSSTRDAQSNPPTELNTSDASRTEENEAVKKLAAEIMEMMPKTSDSKEGNAQPSSNSR